MILARGKAGGRNPGIFVPQCSSIALRLREKSSDRDKGIELDRSRNRVSIDGEKKARRQHRNRISSHSIASGDSYLKRTRDLIRNGDHMNRFFVIALLCLLGSAASAQTSSNEPVLVEQFGRLPNGDMKMRFDSLYVSLQDNPQLRGLVIVSGSDRRREFFRRFSSNYLTLREVETRRFLWAFFKREEEGGICVQFWLMPPKGDLGKVLREFECGP